MPDFGPRVGGIGDMDRLERELHLKQLQINRLLNITQAINDNVPAVDLYSMYTSFLSWEMNVKKMALFVKKEEQWECASYVGISEELATINIADRLLAITRLQNIDSNESNELLKEFDIVIPVLHKETPITYTLIGGLEEQNIYNRVQFITTITNVIAVAIENKRLFKQQIEQERLKREMELAVDMQHMLIPDQLPESPYFELASIYKPKLGIGGDYFDGIKMSEHRIVLCVADISGKGVSAALLMANFQASFQSLIAKHSNFADFVRELNDVLFRITKGDKFLTFFGAVFDGKKKQLTYINAGHTPPILVQNNEVHLLDVGCTILGSFKELPSVEVGRIPIEHNATLLAFTDGLTDIVNDNEEFFNEDQLQSFLLQNPSASASLLNHALLAKLNAFRQNQDFPDDLTVLAARFFPEK